MTAAQILILGTLLFVRPAATGAIVHVSGFQSFDNFLSRKQSVVPSDLTGDGAADLYVCLGNFGAGLVTSPGWQVSGIDAVDLGYDYPVGKESFMVNYRVGEIIGSGQFEAVNWFSHNVNTSDPTNFDAQYTSSALLGYNPRDPVAGDGAWLLVNDGYAGFRFSRPDGGWHYGWVRIQFAKTPFSGIPEKRNGQHFYFSEWAWETEPDRLISAGAVPESSVPLVLTCAVILTTFRRKRH
jgi:hypothetical protein